MSEETVARASSVLEKYNDMLLAKANVQGTAVGLIQREGAYTGEVGIVVMVDRKRPARELAEEDRIPGELDGIAVDVQEMGIFTAQ